jgi:hypothetical protein
MKVYNSYNFQILTYKNQTKGPTIAGPFITILLIRVFFRRVD